MKLRITAIVYLLALFTLGFNNSAQAQIYDPVSWSFHLEEETDESAVLVFKAEIEAGWHVYATELPSEMGPIPTSFEFDKGSGFKLVGGIEEGEFITAYDPNFEMDLNFHDDEAVFKQKVKLTSNGPVTVSGLLNFMVCDDSKCLPPEDVPFSFSLKGGEKKKGSKKESKETKFESSGALDMGSSEVEESGILEPVNWRYSVEERVGNKYAFVAIATIDAGWHMYSQSLDGLEGPMPTEFLFEKKDGLKLLGTVSEPEVPTKYDPVFEMELSYFSGEARFVQEFENTGGLKSLEGSIGYMACDDARCIFPSPVEFNIALPGVDQSEVDEEIAASGNSADSEIPSGSESKSRRSLLTIFIISFLSGFAALLTPCVFPMIPMTVSFFTKQSKTRAAGIKNAVIYGLSIIGIYVLLGVVVTAAFGASVLSEMSTDPWFNLFFFALLIFFAISFLGAFEITLPSSWINKADSKADKGGLIGIFFMAFVLALVSFSCTGPIVGTLIVEAASIGGTAPVIGMLGFSLAIAIPFMLFAAFPGWLNTLPQSGGWLNSVKVVLGFLELALAFKFLSNADLVMDFHFLEREVFLAIWIVIFGLLTLYLLGKLKLPHDSDLEYVSVPRVLLAVVTGVFTVYMIPGMWGAPLKLISAFPPPMQYSESPLGVGYMGGGGNAAVAPESVDQHIGPQNIYVFHDYDKGLAFAKKENLPLMLDFTGKACVNCRKMEQHVWSDPEIKRKLDEEVVLVSLYVDFREKLPESEQITVDLGNGRQKKLRTVGDKWAALQEQKFKVNAQPYYVLLDHNEEKLVEPANYQDYGNVELFNDWLDRGIAKFKE